MEKIRKSIDTHKFILPSRIATSDEIADGKKREDEFIRKHNDAVSYARVHERIWVGNMGTAIGVALGTINRFTGVLNASGCELIDGVSIASIAERFGRSHAVHKTVWDTRGMALLDDRFYDVNDVTKGRILWKETKGPTLRFVHKETLYRTYRSNHTTRASFNVLVLQAATKIKELLETTSGNVLVHCYAGRNRSPACIVAYLLTEVGQSFPDAMGVVEKAIEMRGISGFLSNQDFRDAIAVLPQVREDADAVLFEEMKIIEQNVGGKNVEMEIDGASVGFENDAVYCSSLGCAKHAVYLCNRCGNASYCSKNCQATHWPLHSVACNDQRT